MIRHDTLRAALAALKELRDRRWLNAPCGCCGCGTGGPHYGGPLFPTQRVTRYLYGDAQGIDWASCSNDRLDGVDPIVDYGRDVAVTFRQAELDFADALTTRKG